MSQDLLKIGRAYLEYFANDDWENARSLMTDDFHFTGSIDEFHSADEAIETFSRLGPMLKGIDIKHETAGDSEAVFIYLFHCYDPIGTIPTAEYMQFEDGKIKRSRIFYDPRPFGGVMELPPFKDHI